MLSDPRPRGSDPTTAPWILGKIRAAQGYRKHFATDIDDLRAWGFPMAHQISRPAYRLGSEDFPHFQDLDAVERDRYRRLRSVGVSPQDALPKAREVEDPLPELDDLVVDIDDVMPPAAEC